MSHQHGLPPKEAAEGPYRRCQSRAEDDSGWLDHCRLVLFRTVQRRAHTRQQRQSRGQNVRVVAVSITGSSLPSQHPPTVFLRATLFGSGFVGQLHSFHRHLSSSPSHHQSVRAQPQPFSFFQISELSSTTVHAHPFGDAVSQSQSFINRPPFSPTITKQSHTSIPHQCPHRIPLSIVQIKPSGGQGEAGCGHDRGSVEERIRIVCANHKVMPEQTEVTHKQCLLSRRSQKLLGEDRWFVSVSIHVSQGSCPDGCSIQSSSQQIIFRRLRLCPFAAFPQSHPSILPFSSFHSLPSTALALCILLLFISCRDRSCQPQQSKWSNLSRRM
ncbi:hypothetical protein BLNAU_18140 [Blattamonas nauphoetae]|uniref:Uncharacterized protein n=1 Tax=Blattamonas nauphoetae TaxID=2049346 RepID=A0ABQ9X9H1_9EUKA|nr:hypothetical protein BLNAU_18140 [Blattamonas nauphoetae]